MVHIYTGTGKGKTTAALGLALRAIGYGLKVCVIQFMKGNIDYGEIRVAHRLKPYLTIRQMGREIMVDKSQPDPADRRLAKKGFELARKVVYNRRYDVVILDEINVAIDFGLVKLADVTDLLKKRPESVELILTGRYAPEELFEHADVVTEMIEVKHYYQKGITAREGIDK